MTKTVIVTQSLAAGSFYLSAAAGLKKATGLIKEETE